MNLGVPRIALGTNLQSIIDAVGGRGGSLAATVALSISKYSGSKHYSGRARSDDAVHLSSGRLIPRCGFDRAG